MAGKTVINQLQLGDSATATQNFVLQTNVDGTAKLARGNAGATTQDILTVDASGKVALPQNVQTWQDVTASRVLGTTYTNTTGQPIDIAVTCVNAGSSGATGFVLRVGTIVVGESYIIQQTSAGNFFTTLYARIPSGSTYVATSVVSATLNSWAELR